MKSTSSTDVIELPLRVKMQELVEQFRGAGRRRLGGSSGGHAGRRAVDERGPGALLKDAFFPKSKRRLTVKKKYRIQQIVDQEVEKLAAGDRKKAKKDIKNKG